MYRQYAGGEKKEVIRIPNMRHFSLLFIAAPLLLSGCASGTVQETLGMSRSAPDEFRVVSRPSLSVPPQFNLRPPGLPGESSPSNIPVSAQAESLVNGSQTFSLKDQNSQPAQAAAAKNNKPATNSAESQLLMNAGAAQADPTVRTMLAEERLIKQEQKEEKSWWDFGLTPEKKEPMVDAKKEKERIVKNKEEGKPVTEGETPETKGKDRGILGYIFGD
jgi:hypothetical protein